MSAIKALLKDIHVATHGNRDIDRYMALACGFEALGATRWCYRRGVGRGRWESLPQASYDVKEFWWLANHWLEQAQLRVVTLRLDMVRGAGKEKWSAALGVDDSSMLHRSLEPTLYTEAARSEPLALCAALLLVVKGVRFG